MWEKALCFGDETIASEILSADNPKNAKDLGRIVRNYSESEWAKKRYDAMLDVCIAKFSQNDDQMKTLLSTGDRVLVEGSPYDKVWGVGIHWAEEAILDERNWRGQNLLGQVLMEVREFLKSE